ncbi:Uncharacterised protein [uncultured archaeon]|nr:Uncharacterised protein [uncultured archaeon]
MLSQQIELRKESQTPTQQREQTIKDQKDEIDSLTQQVAKLQLEKDSAVIATLDKAHERIKAASRSDKINLNRCSDNFLNGVTFAQIILESMKSEIEKSKAADAKRD